MSSKEFITNYQDVPEEQRNLFLNFQKEHPYSTISFQNEELKYIVCGEGEETLVFLHGALLKPDMWFYPIIELEKRYRIIAPLFSHQMMGAQEAADFIRAILKKENRSKATFISYSYGGGVAQFLAENYPDLVNKLVLTHTGIAGREGSVQELQRFKKIMKLMPFYLIKKQISSRIEYVHSSDWNEFHKAYFLDINSQLTKHQFLDYIDSILRFSEETKDLPAGTREWKKETIVLGTRSDEDAFEHFDSLLELYPNAKSYIFEEEGGHHMLFLFPEEYTRILSQYLD
jgi:pimeloyl-ACP methyl ester carboxylesterase